MVAYEVVLLVKRLTMNVRKHLKGAAKIGLVVVILLGLFSVLPFENKDVDTEYTRVLLVTYYRGGSTFLGEIFDQNTDAFYWFEPLHLYQSVVSTFHRLPLNERQIFTLTDAISCNASSLNVDVLADFINTEGIHMSKMSSYVWCLRFRFWSWDRYRQCAKCIEYKCISSPLTVIKTIRLPMKFVPQVKEKFPNLKVIFYTRDPRGIISSLVKMTKLPRSEIVKRSKVLCSEMLADSEQFQAQQTNQLGDDYMQIKYEELASHPLAMTERIYQFIGHVVPGTVIGWLEENTKSLYADGTYGTRRDSIVTANTWKYALPGDIKDDVTKQCEDVIKILGYQL